MLLRMWDLTPRFVPPTFFLFLASAPSAVAKSLAPSVARFSQVLSLLKMNLIWSRSRKKPLSFQ